MPPKIRIERCSSLDQPGWLDMRLALWPDATADEHRGYMAISLAQPERFLQLMMYDEQPPADRFHRRLDPRRLRQRHRVLAGGVRRRRVRGARLAAQGRRAPVLSPPSATGPRPAVVANWPRMRWSTTK